MGRTLNEIKEMSEVFANIQVGIKNNIVIEREIQAGLSRLAMILNDELVKLPLSNNVKLSFSNIQKS